MPAPAVLAATALVLGFAVAEATGVRAIGGVVLAVVLALAALRMRVEAGSGRAVTLTATALLAFGLSHVLADLIGAWPAVAIAALATAATGAGLARR